MALPLSFHSAWNSFLENLCSGQRLPVMHLFASVLLFTYALTIVAAWKPLVLLYPFVFSFCVQVQFLTTGGGTVR